MVPPQQHGRARQNLRVYLSHFTQATGSYRTAISSSSSTCPGQSDDGRESPVLVLSNRSVAPHDVNQPQIRTVQRGKREREIPGSANSEISFLDG
ncbi:hypothetical protein JOB18_025562 [Solea senegalensis]|uniref:Uncharacterized protein n=1 Tax=Solea senegalensis TaxID=28829 RepID=A0AAV6RS21_SOLSE|nr:hypothetical protein JOB18_025562 [Solea senegalensis]